MRRTLTTAILFTLTTTVLFGLIYPLLVTGLAQVLFHDQANGELIVEGGRTVGSRLIGQSFSGDRYFHSRPSAAGTGYDAAASGGSNDAPTSRKLVERVNGDVAALAPDHPGAAVPIDLVTASASGLDPDLTPAGAAFQSARVARTRRLPEATVQDLVRVHTNGRQFGFLGEPRVNVLELNRALDRLPVARP